MSNDDENEVIEGVKDFIWMAKEIGRVFWPVVVILGCSVLAWIARH